MKFKCVQFFGKKAPPKMAATSEVNTSALHETSSLTVPHRILRIEIISLQNRVVSLLLTPLSQSKDALDLCMSFKQDFELFGDDSDDDKNDIIKPIALEAKENFCVLVTTQYPDNFLRLLKNAKAITEQEERQILNDIINITKTPSC